MIKNRYVKNTWYAAAWEHEIAAAENKLARTICEQPLVFIRGESGDYFALDNRCCHRAAPLSIGRIEGDNIRCMYHGLLYDNKGKCIEIPGQDRISKNMCVRQYPVAVRGNMLWIWMGDPALANEDHIIDFEPLNDSDNWRGFDKEAYLHYQANWLLIADNLADFSHVAFVHEQTLGGSESYAYESVVEEVVTEEDGVSLDRWHNNSNPPPFHKAVISEDLHDQKVDRLNAVSLHVPGVFLMNTLFAPAGWDKEKNDRSVCHEYSNCQLMTPETWNTTHFFWNYLHNRDRDKPEVTETLRQYLLAGFMEDKLFIEEQQKLLAENEGFEPRLIGADQALNVFRKKWDARIKDEMTDTIAVSTKEII